MAILATMIPLVCIQVFCRYVLNAPITWSEELATYLFAWLIFFGATVTVRRNEVPALRIIVKSLPPRRRPSPAIRRPALASPSAGFCCGMGPSLASS